MNQNCNKTKELPPPTFKLDGPPLHDRLKRVFKASFAAIDIAESLLIFDANKSVAEVKKIRSRQKRGIAGVSEEGQITGYVIKGQFNSGCCGDYMQKMEAADVIDYIASYQDVSRF